jgi:hypothetical protein
MEKDHLKELIDDGLSLAAIGESVGRHESTVAYWMQRHGLRAVNAERHAPRGALCRDDLVELVAEGLSIAQIAERVERSKATVRHWLRRYGLKTWSPSGARRSAESAAARAAGLSETRMACARHGEADFVLDGRGYYRCRKCRAEAVARRRRKMKAILVREAGGACFVCGYSATMRALHFHHLDPNEKRLEINARGVALALDTLRAEARKCVLLCSNCHAEVEDGVGSGPELLIDIRQT